MADLGRLLAVLLVLYQLLKRKQFRKENDNEWGFSVYMYIFMDCKLTCSYIACSRSLSIYFSLIYKKSLLPNVMFTIEMIWMRIVYGGL